MLFQHHFCQKSPRLKTGWSPLQVQCDTSVLYFRNTADTNLGTGRPASVRCSRHCVLCAAVRRETTTADDRRRQLAMTAWTKYTRMSQNRSRAPCRMHAHSHRPLRRHPADETLHVSHDNNHLTITRVHTSIPGLYSSVLAQIDCHLANKTLCTLHRQQGNSVSLKTQCHRPHVLHNKAMVHRMQVRCATGAGKKCWALHQQQPHHVHTRTHIHTSAVQDDVAEELQSRAMLAACGVKSIVPPPQSA